MATCTSSITSATSFVELSSGVAYPSTINATVNSVYVLSSDLDQSVFFNIRVLGNPSSIAITITVYYKNNMRVFGTTNITQPNTNASFSITAGEYYVCIRSQVLPYNIIFTPTFISYSNTATFVPNSYIGMYSAGELTVQKRETVCNRPLLYTIIEGSLPDGLTMLENGYVTGILPMMDCDPYNDELPASGSWYHQLSDSEYVTNWGRAYRFKVHLTLYDDRTKEDEAWFYISIVNNYDKNKAIIDEYEVLEDEYLATFEEKVKLTTLRLCPPCEIQEEVLSDEDIIRNNNNLEYEDVISKLADGEIDTISFDNEYSNYDETDNEMILLTNEYNFNTSPEEFYINNFESTNNIINQLKDSCMFQHYIKENNINEKYIITYSYDRFDYSGIKIEILELNNDKYISMTNTISNKNIIDMNDSYTNNYISNLEKVPLTGYSFYGFTSNGVLK